MSTSKALDGFRPSRIRGSGSNSTGNSEYRIASGYNANIFTGDIVKNVDGYINVITNTTDIAAGVFVGCNYTANGEPKWSKYWPSGTSASDIKALVVDGPSPTFIIQADASCTVGDINSYNFDVTLGAGSTVTGKSGFGLKASTRTTGSAMVRPIGVWDVPGNDIDVGAERAFPVLEVRLVQTQDAYVSTAVS